MPSYSKTIIIGHLGKDPEVRYTNSGFAICSFTVATSEKWNDKQTGEKKEETEWHRCVVMGAQAERAAEWLHKGSLVMVEGQNRTNKWQDKEGNDRYTTEIKVWKFSPLDPPNRSTKPAPQQADSFDDMDIPF